MDKAKPFAISRYGGNTDGLVAIKGKQNTGWDASRGETKLFLLTGKWGLYRRLDDGSAVS